MAKARLELDGKRFGKLQVSGLHSVNIHGTIWNCLCDCGNTHIARGAHLTSGQVSRCRECVDKGRRNPNGIGDMSVVYWNQVLKGARSRGIAVSISAQQAYDVFLRQNGRCALSGVPIQFPPRTNWSHLHTASLDRIDSKLGYELDNIQWIHKIINKMKMEFDQTDFIEWCKKVANYDSSTIVSTEVDPPT